MMLDVRKSLYINGDLPDDEYFYSWQCCNNMCVNYNEEIPAPEYNWRFHNLTDDELCSIAEEDYETFIEFIKQKIAYENRNRR